MPTVRPGHVSILFFFYVTLSAPEVISGLFCIQCRSPNIDSVVMARVIPNKEPYPRTHLCTMEWNDCSKSEYLIECNGTCFSRQLTSTKSGGHAVIRGCDNHLVKERRNLQSCITDNVHMPSLRGNRHIKIQTCRDEFTCRGNRWPRATTSKTSFFMLYLVIGGLVVAGFCIVILTVSYGIVAIRGRRAHEAKFRESQPNPNDIERSDSKGKMPGESPPEEKIG